MKKLLMTLSLLVSTSALAHTGHLANEFVHSFLHVEHIILLAVAGVLVYLMISLNNK